MFLKLINRNKSILCFSLILQFAGLFLFAATDLKLILPVGNSTLIDLIYSLDKPIQYFYYILNIAISIILLFRQTSKVNRISVSILFLTFGLFKTPWFSVIIYPFFVHNSKNEKPSGKSNTHNILTLGLGIVISSFFLMTLQSSFPHDSLRNIIYLQGISTVFLFIPVLAGLLFLSMLAIIKQFLNKNLSIF